MRTEYLIEAYFSDQLTAEEQKELKALLEADEAVREEFRFQNEIREAVRKKERSELKLRLQSLEESSSGNPYVKWWAAAAAIAVFVGSAWYFGMFQKQMNYDQLFAARFEVYPNVVAPLERSDPGLHTDLTREAFRYYDNENFGDAHAAFQKLYQQENEEFALFYAGVSLMAEGKYGEAIDRFENAKNFENQEFAVVSKWYIALGHLKTGNEKASVKYLEAVMNSDHPLNQAAEDLLSELE